MIEIRFPCPLVVAGRRTIRAWSTNDDRKFHWTVRRRLVKAWREAACFAFRVAEVGPQPPSIVEIAIPFERNVRRDPMNYVGTVVKAVVDGLVDAGLWPDDTPEFVTVVQPMLEIGSDVTVRVLRRPD